MPWLKGLGNYKGHVCVRGKNYAGPGAGAFNVACSTPFEKATDDNARQKIVQESLSGMISTMPARLRQAGSQMAVRLAMGEIRASTKCGRKKQERRKKAVIAKRAEEELQRQNKTLSQEVGTAGRKLKGAVISEIDKSNGELLVM